MVFSGAFSAFKKISISCLGKFLFFIFFLSFDYFLTYRFFSLDGVVCNYFCVLGIKCFLFDMWGVLLFPLGVAGFFFLRTRNIQKMFGWGFMFVGGVSNILDRAIFGCVYDIFSFFNLFYWNIADGYIFFGVILLLLSFFLKKHAIMQ